MQLIVIKPDPAAKCWTGHFLGGAFTPGIFPLPFTLEAPIEVVAAQLRAQFPTAKVTGVQAACEGCGQ